MEASRPLSRAPRGKCAAGAPRCTLDGTSDGTLLGDDECSMNGRGHLPQANIEHTSHPFRAESCLGLTDVGRRFSHL